jgi:hypothetical protein
MQWACAGRPWNTRSELSSLGWEVTEMSLHVIAYNMKRVMAILGVGALMQAIRV